MIYPSFLGVPILHRHVRVKKWNNPETPPSSFFQIWYPIYILIKTWDLAPVSFIHLSGGGWWYQEPPGCEIKKLYNWSSRCLTLIFITPLTLFNISSTFSPQYEVYPLCWQNSLWWNGVVVSGVCVRDDNWVMIVDKTHHCYYDTLEHHWSAPLDCVSRV